MDLEAGGAANLTQRRRAATQLDIETAAIGLFEEFGFDAVTVDQIAERAAVSTRTFYRYCSGKDDAITSHLGRGAAELARHVAEDVSMPLAEAVIAGFMLSSAADRGLDHLRRVVALVVSIPALRGRWLAAGRDAQAALAPVIAERLPRWERLQAEAVAGAVISALTTALESWARQESTDLREAAVRCLAPLTPVL
jgi:AcrR family transcriptional regulator